MNIPSWFGQFEFYVVVATVWLYLISWIVVNVIRVGGVKWDIKKHIVNIKSWWAKKTGKTYDTFEEYGFKEYVE